jgi:hypothetical protein
VTIFIPLVLIIVWRAIKTNLEVAILISTNDDQSNNDDLGLFFLIDYLKKYHPLLMPYSND